MSQIQRANIIARAVRLRGEILQTFVDVASWNDNVRKPDQAPIDPDPTGELEAILDGINRSLAHEAASGGRGPLLPIVPTPRTGVNYYPDPLSTWRLGPRRETSEESAGRHRQAVERLLKGVEIMSWSNSWIGKPSAIKAALATYSETLSGASKEEFEAARPALETLLDQNSNKEREPIVHLEGNGHAYTLNGERQYSSCQVSIKNIGTLCE